MIAGLGNLISKGLGIEGRTSAAGVQKGLFGGKESIFAPGARAFQQGGVVPGNLGTPVPIIAHAGERIIPAGKNGGSIVINATYNVNVSDKREFEIMLRENNIKLSEDVRRLVKT